MKPYDKSNSFMQRVTKRVSELIPGSTWMNMILGESQSDDDPSLSRENDDQPPVKKLCTSNNTFTNVNKRTCIDVNPTKSSIDNHKNSHVNILSSEISAVTCLPSTSKHSTKIIPNQPNSSSDGHDNGNRSSLKRKSDVVDASNLNRTSQKLLAFNFASSTPTVNSVNKLPTLSLSLKPLKSDKRLINNEFSTPTSSKLLKSRGNDSQSSSICRETTNQQFSPSFRWDTFVNYGELSERQRLFAQKSPLNCSQAMYGGNSARSNLSKILGNTPPIHRKATIPISPTKKGEIRTTSSILLGQISTKDKKIEENKFIIQPKINLRHKADQKTVPIRVETTVKLVDTTPEKVEEKSNENISMTCSGRDSSRKLRANISKKVRGLQSDELEMPAKVDLPNIFLPMPVLPSINLSNNDHEDNEFTFSQPLSIEQFSLQIAAKSSRKKLKITKKLQNSILTQNVNDQHSGFTTLSSPCNFNSHNKTEKLPNVNNDSEVKNSKNKEHLSGLSNTSNDSSKKPVLSSSSDLQLSKTSSTVHQNLPKVINSTSNQQPSEKSPTEPKKWTCDACWVSNNGDKLNCIACQTPKPGNSVKPTTVTKPSTWTCETCWVPNKNEVDSCVACQTQKPGTTKKVLDQSSNWTCDACWVKNKSDCITCISCGTSKPGLAPDTKPQPSTQFKFGLNNNTFDTSGSSQFKFGLDTSNTDQSSSQFKFGVSSTFKSLEDNKSVAPNQQFKFGLVENKIDNPIGSYKFGSDNVISEPTNKPIETLNSKLSDKPSGQFKFGIENKLDQPEGQFKFGLNSVTNNSISQFKFGGTADDISEKSVPQTFTVNSNKVTLPSNDLNIINDKKEISEKSTDLTNKSSTFKFGDSRQTEKSTPQLTFGSIKTDSNNSNLFSTLGNKNVDQSKDKFVWDKNNKVETKSVHLGVPQTNQSDIENSNTIHLVNGHSSSKEATKEEPKSGLIKTSQLFSFGSLAKQDQNLPDDQKKSTGFTFGSVTNDDKSFVTPIGTSSFSSTSTVFGASNAVFGSGSTSLTPGTLGLSSLKPQFTFGSTAPAPDGFFSKTNKDNDKKPAVQSSTIFTSASNVGFSFGAQSPPVFSVTNAGGPSRSTFQADNRSNNIFSQSSAQKSTVKLDPNAPISINFTGGATTQFTANPETSEPTPKRKILKPVRRIR